MRSGYKIWIILSLTALLYNCADKNQSLPADETATQVNEEDLKTIILSTKDGNAESSIKRIDSVLRLYNTDSAAFCGTADYLKKFFSNPNSPYRNEKLTIHLLQSMMQSDFYTPSEKDGLEKQINLAMQNRVGNIANDFTFITADNTKQTLHSLTPAFTIIFFNNPDCPACKEYKTAFGRSTIINRNIKNKQLQVLSMYIDKDLPLWQKHISDFPKSWIIAHDENEYLYKNGVYNLHAIPTIYLLDKNKKVLLKDCMSISEIEQFLP